MRSTSVLSKVLRGDLFARLVAALHASRRLEARRVLRRYRHLIAQDFHRQPENISSNFNRMEKSIADADPDQNRIRADNRTLQGV
jgi:hypothetical protein